MADDNTQDEDVAKLAPRDLPLSVTMAVLNRSTATKDNQNSGKLIGIFDHVFAATHTQGETQKTILFTETIKGEGFTWDCRESGVWIKFSPKTVPEPKMITCSLWCPSAVSLPNKANESLVSSIIQLACDDPVGVNFSGVTVALSHSAVDMGGYEMVMNELTDPKNGTWKNLNTTKVTWDPSEPLLENSEWQSGLRFVQATITSFSLYAVICRLKSYKFSFDALMKSPELTCQVPSPISECSDVRVTIPRKSLSKEEVELTMKVQEVPNDDYEEKRAFFGPILHLSCPDDVELKQPASIRIPVASGQDLQKLQSLSISNVRICYRSTQDSSQEWVDITEELRPPAKLENGTVAFQVNQFSLYTVILVSAVFQEAGILELRKFDSYAPQVAGFLACLCSIKNSDERLLFLCCYPLHMANEVWNEVSSRYTVVRHGQDTSRHPLNREDKVSFSLPDELSPCEQIDMETKFLRFLGHKPFPASFKVPAKKIESAPEITFFKRNGLEKALCTVVIVPVSAPQHDRPSTSQDMSGDQVSLDEIEMRKELLTKELILKIKDDIGTYWYDLGIELGIERAKVANLEQDYRLVRDRANQVLEIWSGENGRGATVGRLACALIKIGHRRIADNLLAISKSTQPSEREGERSTQPSEQEDEQSKLQPGDREGECSKLQPSEEDEQPKLQPGDREGEQSKYPSEQRGKQSKQQSERGREQFKQPSEPEAQDDIFSLLAEVQQLRKKVTGSESQPKEHNGEQAKQPTRWEGEQSKQHSEHETADDMFSLLADIQELTKTTIERKRQRTEDETLKKMIEDTKQMNMQVQQLIKKTISERK